MASWVTRVLDLVRVATAAALSACAFFTYPISMQDCFSLSFTPSEIMSFVLSASIQQSRPPQALCYGSEVDSCVGHLLLPAVCCYDRLLSVAVQPPQGGTQWVDSLKLDLSPLVDILPHRADCTQVYHISWCKNTENWVDGVPSNSSKGAHAQKKIEVGRNIFSSWWICQYFWPS